MVDYTKNSSSRFDRRTYLKTAGGLSVSTLAALAGCSGNGDNSSSGGTSSGGNTDSSQTTTQGGYSKPIDEAFLTVGSLQNDIWKAMLQGAKEAAEDLGLTNGVSAQAHKGNPSDQISQVSSAVTSGSDIVAGTGARNAGVETLAETAVQNNVPMLTYWAMGKWLLPPNVGPEFVHYQIPETFKAGAIPAKILFEEMGGEGNIVAVLGPEGHIGSFRFEGMKSAMEEYPDINLFDFQYSGGWTRKRGREVMSSFVSQYGDQIDGVYCNNGTIGLGVATILSENDMAIPFTGFDGAKSNIDYIKNNAPDSGQPYQVQSQAAPPFWQGGWSVVRGYDWLHGWRPRVPERMMWTRTLTVLNPGLDQSKYEGMLDTRFTSPEKYNSVAYSSGHSPYDWEKMSIEESGDDWDPQHLLVPIRKSQWNQLQWNEENKPSSLAIPDVYDNKELFDEVEQDYRQRNENGMNPYL